MPASATTPSTTVLGVRLVPDLRRKVEEVAQQRQMTLSEATRELLAMALAQLPKGA